jgi:arylsulfatase A-like enzyme
MKERSALRRVAAPTDAPNVLLVVLDTVRATSLSLYGYERRTSPALERFAARGTTFLRAYSTTSWTLPSHATLFTGRYPYELTANWTTPLDGAAPTLAAAFAERGYATGGFVANLAYTSRETGLHRGFDRYEDRTVGFTDFVIGSSLGRFVANNPRFRAMIGHYDILGRKPAREVGGALVRWVDGLGGRPYFAFLNVYDAHEPYLPPAPFDAAFGPAGLRNLHEIRQLNPHTSERGHRRPITVSQLQAEQRAYDQAIAWLDDQLGELFATLEDRGDLRNTIVVVTADHGEHFGEHGQSGHGTALYLPTLHVPLVIVSPGRVPAGARQEASVTLRDVPATISALALAEPSLFPGHSLFAPAGGEVSPILASIEPVPGKSDGRTPLARGPMRSAIVAGHHYILSGDGREELYDLRADPNEMTDLSTRSSARTILEQSRATLRLAGAVRP